MMEDEAGHDEKIICVPHDSVHPQYSDVKTISDLPNIMRGAIEHFFERYKDFEKDKWVKVTGWAEKEAAAETIRKCIIAAR